MLDRLPTLQPALQLAAADQVAHSTLPARIYLQYLNAEKSYVDPVVQQLKSANFRVKELGNTTSSRPKIPSVGYYYREDEAEARQLIALLKRSGAPKVQDEPIFLKGSTRPRHFDVWLPRAE